MMLENKESLQQMWTDIMNAKPVVARNTTTTLPKNKAERDALQKRLAAACISSDLNLITEIVEEGANINAVIPIELENFSRGRREVSWMYPVHYFALKGNIAIIEGLCDSESFSVDLTVEVEVNGSTTDAMTYAFESKNQDIILALIRRGMSHQKFAVNKDKTFREQYVGRLVSNEVMSDLLMWWMDRFYQNNLSNVLNGHNFDPSWVENFLSKVLGGTISTKKIDFVKKILSETEPKVLMAYANKKVFAPFCKDPSDPVHKYFTAGLSEHSIVTLWSAALQQDDIIAIRELIKNNWIIDPLKPIELVGCYQYYVHNVYDSKNLNFLSRAIKQGSQKVLSLMLASPMIVESFNQAITAFNEGNDAPGFSGIFQTLSETSVNILDMLLRHGVRLECFKEKKAPHENFAHFMGHHGRISKSLINSLMKHGLGELLSQKNSQGQTPFEVLIGDLTKIQHPEAMKLKSYYEKAFLSKLFKTKVKEKTVTLATGKQRRM